MSHFTRRQIIRAGATIGAVALGQCTFCESSFAAQGDTNDEVNRIARALMPPVRRGGEADHTAEQQPRLKNVRLKRDGLNLQERDELYEATRSLPQIALESTSRSIPRTFVPTQFPILTRWGRHFL